MSVFADICKRFQGFALNFNPFYQGQGLMGHPGIDEGCGYGSEVHTPVEGLVIAMYTPERPASDGYVAVYILVKTAYELMEFTIGHLSEISVQIGQYVKKGDLIGKEGNKGVVYVGQERITLAMQAAGDQRGSHRHYQCRPVIEVKKRANGRTYIRNASGYIKGPIGGYLEHALHNNGYASCVDFTQAVFRYDFGFGSRGYYVALLQKILGMPESAQTGFYGDLTQAAVREYQEVHGLPDTGYFGPQTREIVNAGYDRMEGILETTEAEIAQAGVVLGSVPTLPLQEDRQTIISWVGALLSRLLVRIGG